MAFNNFLAQPADFITSHYLVITSGCDFNRRELLFKVETSELLSKIWCTECYNLYAYMMYGCY